MRYRRKVGVCSVISTTDRNRMGAQNVEFLMLKLVLRIVNTAVCKLKLYLKNCDA